jgi:hypothetical protein
MRIGTRDRVPVAAESRVAAACLTMANREPI